MIHIIIIFLKKKKYILEILKSECKLMTKV